MYRVLMLEDEEDLVRYLPMHFKEKGLETVATTSITEALESFTKEAFDIVLLDIMMPPTEDMDAKQLDYGRETGVEVARRMKSIKPDVPIVALTVVNDQEIRARMRTAGIVEIISKPSDPDQIADALLRSVRTKK